MAARHRREKPVNHGDWSNLPKELLELIFLRLKHAGDLIRFAVACRSWRSVAAEARQRLYTKLSPLLLLSRHNYGRFSQDIELFYFPETKAGRLRLPAADSRRRCRFSTNGWLVTIHCDPVHAIHLLNPLLRSQIQLPPPISLPNIPDIPHFYHQKKSIHKVIASSSPRNPDCIVVVIYSDRHCLAFCRVGDKEWKSLRSEVNYFRDVLCYKDRVYAVRHDASVVRCDVDPEPKVVEVSPPVQYLLFQEYYLVESSGDFLMVIRDHFLEDKPHMYSQDYRGCREDDNYRTGFVIFKLDIERGKREEVHSLGDNSLFLGFNQSFSISTKEFPEFQGDCIYFTEELWGDYDVGVFNLKTGHELTFPKKSPFFWLTPDLSSSCSNKEKSSMLHIW